MSYKKRLRKHELSPDGVAAIRVIGEGKLGKKCANLLEKRETLDRCGFLFPRRNLVVTSDVVLDTLRKSGLDEGWDAGDIGLREKKEIFSKFRTWAVSEIWPLVKEIFEHRAMYIRSDTSWDSLGRGVYDSVPFANGYGSSSDDAKRAEAFSRGFFQVVMSYFDETAAHVSRKLGITDKGINVFFSQFIGRDGEFPLHGWSRRALVPFISAVVKTTIVSGKRESLVRFEYGLGSGALVGRTMIIGEDSTTTLSKKQRKEGIHPDLINASPEVIVLPDVRVENVDGSNWAVIDMLMKSAYPQISGSTVNGARTLLSEIVENVGHYEAENSGIPLYLELVSSSFRDSIRWFAVQAGDFEPVNPLPPPEADADFTSNKDFSGHGIVKGRKKLFIFGKDSFSTNSGMRFLEEINNTNDDFIVILPQHVFTGNNLVSLDARHFFRARAILEYERLSVDEMPNVWHKQGPPSEHFEQLALDLDLLFIPVDYPFSSLPFPVPPEGIIKTEADVLFACDKERGISWGKMINMGREYKKLI
jgi:hypothetical protein